MAKSEQKELIDTITGKKGTINIIDTALHTGNWEAIQFIADSVIASLTESSSSGSLATKTITAGTIIYGQFTAIQLTSGIARCYNA
jgi:hypothetical protein